MVDASIHIVDQGRMTLDYNHLVDGAIMNSSSDPNPDLVRKEIPVFALLIDHPEATILMDSGSHPDAGNGHWKDWLYDASHHYDAHEHDLAQDLEKMGWSINDIDAVFMTHLHLDHAGGLRHFDGTDVPIYVNEQELKYAWYSAVREDGDVGYVRGDFDHDLNWTPLHREVETHFEDFQFRHLPGHTPGFTGASIHLDDHGTIIIAGDLLYLDENYQHEEPLGAHFLDSRLDWLESVRTVRELERTHDDAQVVYGHDLEQFEELGDGWT